MIIDDAKLAEWKALAEKATAGPWQHWEADDGHPMVIVEDGTREDGSEPIQMTIERVTADGSTFPGRIEDAAFIAASRAMVPALIEEVERFRARTAIMAEALRRAEWVECNGFMICLFCSGEEVHEPGCRFAEAVNG